MRYITVLALTILAISCDRPECTDHNPIFERNDPKSEEYKAELVRQLLHRKPKSIDYSINCYDEIDNIPYLVVDIISKNLCAKGYLNIKNAGRMEWFKKVRGNAYHGAGLAGLKYHIDSSGGNYNFIFDDVDWIMD
jgi:hypothetical protein